VSIDVAALNLHGVGNVVWDVEVVNGAAPAQVVWQKRLASSGYGDGAGSASYVGPCDADPAASENTVKVWVVGVYSAPVSAVGTFAGGAAGGATGDAIAFDNPTLPGDPLEKTVTCSPNSDAKVRFDVSLARPAEQGFFDVAVSFEDIFCSAKLDCENDQGGDLDLLHDATGARDMTAVFGFACTASPTGSTYLYMDDPYILCDGHAPLEVKVDANGQGTVDFGHAPSANPGGYLFAASVYRGVEALAHKAYWNISFGLNEAAFETLGKCTLIGRATASKNAFPQEPEGFPLPEGAVYPVIDWSVELSHGGETPGRSCSQHQVNVDGSGVATNYLGYLAAPNAFSWATDVIYLDNRFEPATGIVLKKAGFSCNPSCAHGSCSGVDTCDCTGTGYTGDTCATPACTTPCDNGGLCAAPDTCDCAGTGYEGASCATDIDECTVGSDNCDMNGTCANTAGSFSCACNAGFAGNGVTCDACPAGEVQPSAGEAACVPCGAGTYDDGSEVCASCSTCDAEHYQTAACIATADTQCAWCPEVGNCSTTVTCTTADDAVCASCPAGRAQTAPGQPCTDIDGCAGNPCAAGVSCTDVPAPGTGFTCGACPTGQWGDGETCTGCTAVAVCAGSLSCTTADDSVCSACAAGYSQVSAGDDCTDVDECGLGTDNCDANATCTNTSGGFTCACNSGYEGDGTACSDIDGCAGTACAVGVSCTDVAAPGTGFTCGACPAGQWGDGVTCTVCAAVANCAGTLSCTTAADSVCSACATGYGQASAGADCADVDECALGTDDCDANATCANSVGSFSCTCVAGYYGDGVTCPACTAIGNCTSGLTCTNASDSQCSSCAPGYAEPGCTDIDDCSPSPCLNGGTCIDGVDSYACSCVNGYIGTDCEVAPMPAAFSCTGTVCANNTTGEVYVPAGDFWMGCNATPNGTDANCSGNEFWQHLVTLSAYAIDRGEVTASAYTACVTDGACTVPSTTGGTYGTYEPAVSKQDHPINYVNWNQASSYCAWAGKAAGAQRLCTEAEWERAARGGCDTVTGDCSDGSQMRKYPWDAGDGSATVPPTCSLANMDNAGYCEPTTYTAAVGSRPIGASPYGAYDMAGNVWEWVNDGYASSYGGEAVTNPSGSVSSSNRVYRGGGFSDVAADVRASKRYSAPPENAYYVIGFRCCRSEFCAVDADCGAGQTCSDSACIDDPCDPEPCLNGGTCSPSGVSYTCSCIDGYTGDDCEIVPPPSGFSCTGAVCANDTTGEVWVPAGDFWMGCNSVLDANCVGDESAQHVVMLSEYVIDRGEVTASEYKACVVAGACTVPSTTGGTWGTYDPAGKQDHPINYVDWNQASAYCAWNKPGTGVQRLCTEAEGEKAARGGCDTVTGDCSNGNQMRKYPWDMGDGSPAIEPTDCTYARWNGCSVATDTSAVGSYPAGASPYGVYDMAGNVWEWVSDWYESPYAGGAMTDPTGPASGLLRVVRGGSFFNVAASVRASTRGHLTPNTAGFALGFRCCGSLP